MTRHTFELVLEYSIHRPQQELKHSMIRLLLQQELRTGHLDEQIEELGGGGAL